MAHQTKIREAMAKIKLAQANLAELYEELSNMIPSEKRAKDKAESAKTRLNLKAKIIG
jgi:FtsZ-binding cell division protein ZapB